jgi:hypothetical protein
MNRIILALTLLFAMQFLYVRVAIAGNSAEALKVLDQQLKQAGIQMCYAKVVALSKYLMSSDDVNFALQTIGPANNGSLTMTIANSTSMGAALSSWTLYVSQNICSGTYEQINHWDLSCADVKKNFFGSFKSPQNLISDITQYELNSMTHVYFVPSKLSGCTTIKKELLP